MAGSKSKKTVLVVDDNRQFCENMKDLLELQGYAAVTAYSGPGAVEFVRRTPPDVVLLDIAMPEMDGVTTFRQIRQITPSVPVVLLTGFSEEQRAGEAIQEGAFCLLQKPPDYHKLFDVIQQCSKAA